MITVNNILEPIRRFIWRLLGINYNHALRVMDYVFLKEYSNAYIGHKSYSNNSIVFRWSDAPIRVGRFCSIADGVRFILDNGGHQIGGVTNYPFEKIDSNENNGIFIGNDVWIGQAAIILPGIHIGNGVTIAAGAVVTRDVPDYCIVAGVPAKIIKEKCTESEKNELNKIAWWNWEDNKIEKYKQDFRLSIPEFIEKHRI